MRVREVADRLASASGCRPRSDGHGGFLTTCPAHDDKRPSLHVSAGKRQAVLVRCLAGCETATVLARAGLLWQDVCGGRVAPAWSQATEEYCYVDASGAVLFVVCRSGHGVGKRFCCYRYADDGSVVRDARTVTRVLYHLPEVIGAARDGVPIYLCEGEKDADALRAACGIVATTNPFGATVWAADAQRFGYAERLRGAEVVVVEDRDQTGRRRTHQILASLSGIAASVRVVSAAVGNDAADHVSAGLGLDELVPIAARELTLADDGSFAALPQAFFAAAAACNLSHLDYRIFVEVARASVARRDGEVAWRAIPCPSSWLARVCGGASPSAVRRSLAGLRSAGLLVDGLTGDAVPTRGTARHLRVNGEFAVWRPLKRAAGTPRQASSAETTPVLCRHTSTREDLGVREERKRSEDQLSSAAA